MQSDLFFTCSELNIVQFVGMYQPSNLKFGSLPALVVKKMDCHLFEYVVTHSFTHYSINSPWYTSQGMCYLYDLDPPCTDTLRPDTS